MISRRTFMKIVAALPITTLAPEQAFANETSDDARASVLQTSENELAVTDADGTWTITVAETEDIRRVNLVGPNGETEYLLLNKQEKTLYSSITGETIDASDAELEGGSDQPQPYGLGTVYPIRRSKPTYYYRRYSYASIKASAGAAAGVAKIAGVIASRCGASNIKAAADIIAGLGGIITAVGSASTSHGLRAKLRKVRVYEYHDFQQKWIEINPEVTVAGISTY